MDLLKVDHLSVDFVQGSKPFHAVRDVSLSIKKGETLALVGESGSGKSVTAHSVMGLLPPSAKLEQGTSILFDGQELLKKQEKELQLLRGNRIGMIFQEPLSSLNPLHTIGKQIAESLQLHQGVALIQLKKKVVELLERVEIQNAEDRFCDMIRGISRSRGYMTVSWLARLPQSSHFQLAWAANWCG